MDANLALVPAHLLFAYMVLGEPWLGVVYYRRLQASLALDPGARARYFKVIIAWEWAWLPAIALALIAAGEGPAALGLALPSDDGWLMTGVVVLSLAVSTYVALRVPATGRNMQRQLERARALLPTNTGERRLFALLAVTAGICEELLYRGFLGWYLTTVVPGVSLLLVGILSGVIFGLAHAYQGKGGALATGAFGAALYGVYWFSSSLLPAMLAHALSDLRAILLAPATPTHQEQTRGS